MNRPALFLAALSLWIGVFEAPGHNTVHDYTIVGNGVIEIGREAEAGGCIVWAAEAGGENIVNNHDLGRQIQVAVREGSDPNPTQAGDGRNASGSELFHVDSDYIYSKCIPLLFYNRVPPPYPRRAMNQYFHCWTEFLPDSGGRAFWWRIYWENFEPYEGASSGQEIDSACYQNWTQFNKLVTYDGLRPWSGGALTEWIKPTEEITPNTSFLPTEQWCAVVDNAGWGLAKMTSSSNGSNLFFNTTVENGAGDHQNRCITQGMPQRFHMNIQPGETAQYREGWTIFYLGGVDDARAFFETYKARPAGNFHDDFNDGDALGWDLNTNPTTCHDGYVTLGATSSAADISLPQKVWGDALFEVDLKLESGTSWYGLAFRKAGANHFAYGQGGYYFVHITAGGVLVLRSSAGVIKSAAIGNYIPGFSTSEWHTLSVEADGFDFTVNVNGVTLITAPDPSPKWPSGYVSLGAQPNMSFSFDNFSVTAIGDETPPTQAANFTLTPGADRNSLTWTNPTDEDWRWTRIVRTDAAPSAHPRGGYPVYEGKLAYYNDIDLTPGAPHYYAAYTVDHSGNYSEPIALAVNVSPVVTTDPADLTVGLGQTAMFSIQASPQPLTYLWLKDKSPLSDDGRITGSATPALSIQNATLADEAAYSCVATNNSLAPQTAISAEGRLSIARSQSSEWLGYK